MDIGERVVRAVEIIYAENRRDGKPLYAFRAIPCEIDTLISDFVRMFMQAAMPERRLIIDAIPPRAGGFLTCFAERMATLGVRKQSRQILLEGLVALVVESYKEDFRDNLINLAPLYDAALRTGVDPQALFNEAASYLNNAPARDIAEFPRRKLEDRDLASMGFIESSDADGFKYERTW